MSVVEGIPVHWTCADLKCVCLKITDGTHHSPTETEQTRAGEFKYITAKNIKEWGIDLSNVTYLPERVHRPIYERCNPEPGDILYIKDGVTTGIATVNTLEEEFSLLSSVALLKPQTGIVDSRFLKWFLNSPIGFRSMTSKMTGTAIKRLTLSKIKEARVPLAPMSEQHRIVAKIEELFSDLDAGVAALQRVRTNLKRYRAAVLKAAVEGRLTEVWRGQNPPTEPADKLLERILAERRTKWEEDQLRKYAETGKTRPKKSHPEAVSRALDIRSLPPLPAKWVWASVKEVGGVQLGRQRSPAHHTGPHMRPYLRVANVFEDRIDTEDVMEMNFSPAEYEIYRLEPNDILLNEGQSMELIGRPAMYRGEVPGACFTNTLVRFKSSAAVLPGFALIVFLAYLKNRRFQNIATITVNIAHLGAGRFAELEFPLPPLLEQEEIVAEVERRLSIVEAVEAEVNHGLKRAARLRQAILKRAFEGKLVPQDPSDEPASTLLERLAVRTSSRQAKQSHRPRSTQKTEA